MWALNASLERVGENSAVQPLMTFGSSDGTATVPFFSLWHILSLVILLVIYLMHTCAQISSIQAKQQ